MNHFIVGFHIHSSLRAGEPDDNGDGRRADDQDSEVIHGHSDHGTKHSDSFLVHGMSPWLYDS